MRRGARQGKAMQDIFAHVAAHADEYVARLRKLCRQPSIAATGEGMKAAAAP